MPTFYCKKCGGKTISVVPKFCGDCGTPFYATQVSQASSPSITPNKVKNKVVEPKEDDDDIELEEDEGYENPDLSNYNTNTKLKVSFERSPGPNQGVTLGDIVKLPPLDPEEKRTQAKGPKKSKAQIMKEFQEEAGGKAKQINIE